MTHRYAINSAFHWAGSLVFSNLTVSSHNPDRLACPRLATPASATVQISLGFGWATVTPWLIFAIALTKLGARRSRRAQPDRASRIRCGVAANSRRRVSSEWLPRAHFLRAHSLQPPSCPADCALGVGRSGTTSAAQSRPFEWPEQAHLTRCRAPPAQSAY